MNAIDLFAGLGGFTEGAEQAGLNVVWAANHWPLAVRYHKANHPTPRHETQDLSQADFTKVPQHHILLASPSCVGHTKARGKEQPHHDAARSTAWAVVTCAEVHRPLAAIVENVPEMRDWILYPAWRVAMEALGYTLTENVVDCADFGVPQHRVRLVIVAVRGKAVAIENPHRPHVPAREVIRLDDGNWSKVRKPGRACATLRRIQRGRSEFGDTFVMPYYTSGSGLTGRSLDRPLGTVTTRDRWAIVHKDRMRMLTVNEYRRFMGFPESCRLPAVREDAIKLLGNAIPPPMARDVVAHVAKVA